VAKAVVDFLKAVEIDYQHTKCIFVHLVFGQRGLQRHLQKAAVWHLGEMVKESQPIHRLDFPPGLNHGRIVVEDLDRTDDGAVGSPHGLDLYGHWHSPSLLMPKENIRRVQFTVGNTFR
jgi:hypothetical protein